MAYHKVASNSHRCLCKGIWRLYQCYSLWDSRLQWCGCGNIKQKKHLCVKIKITGSILLWTDRHVRTGEIKNTGRLLEKINNNNNNLATSMGV